MMEESYYDILGVRVDANASELKSAYRREAMKWHPDKNLGSKKAEERFKFIAEAYAALSEPQMRHQYDEAIGAGVQYARAEEPVFDYETASNMFYSEMVSLAYELTFKNIPWLSIASELMKRGCPESVAVRIAREIESKRKGAVREAAKEAFLAGLGIFALGAVASAIMYAIARPGGTYIVAAGALLGGGWQMIRALFYLTTGRAPRAPTAKGST